MEFFYIYIDISYFLDCRFTIFLFSFQDLYLSEQRRGGKKRIIGEESDREFNQLLDIPLSISWDTQITVVGGLLREKGEDEERHFDRIYVTRPRLDANRTNALLLLDLFLCLAEKRATGNEPLDNAVVAFRDLRRRNKRLFLMWNDDNSNRRWIACWKK